MRHANGTKQLLISPSGNRTFRQSACNFCATYKGTDIPPWHRHTRFGQPRDKRCRRLPPKVLHLDRSRVGNARTAVCLHSYWKCADQTHAVMFRDVRHNTPHFLSRPDFLVSIGTSQQFHVFFSKRETCTGNLPVLFICRAQRRPTGAEMFR